MSEFNLYPITKTQDKIYGSKTPFPQSNYRTIIFPFDLSLNKYNIQAYRSIFTGNRVSEPDIYVFFERLDNSIEVLKEISPDSTINRLRAYVLTPLVMFTLGGMVRLLAQTQDGNFYEYLEFFGKWIVQFLSLFWLAFGLFFLHVKSNRYELEIYIKVADHIARENARFEKAGLKWRLPEGHFYWLELDMYFKEKEDPELFYEAAKQKNLAESNIYSFEFNHSTKKYEIDFYQSKFTNDYIWKTEVNDLFEGIYQHMGPDFRSENSALLLKFLTATCGFIFISGLIFGLLHDFFIAHFVLLCDFLFFFMTGYRILEKKYRRTRDIRYKLETYIKGKNSIIENRGIRWHIPPPGYNLVELWLDYKFVLEASEQDLPKLEDELPKIDVQAKDLNTIPAYKWGDRINLSEIRPPEGLEHVIKKVEFIRYEDDEQNTKEESKEEEII